MIKFGSYVILRRRIRTLVVNFGVILKYSFVFGFEEELCEVFFFDSNLVNLCLFIKIFRDDVC